LLADGGLAADPTNGTGGGGPNPRDNLPAMTPESSPAPAGWGRKLDDFLESPVAGLSPWILMAVIEGPARFELAAAAALGVAVVVAVLGWIRGTSPKLLEILDVAFFAGLTLLAAVAGDELRDVLEKWAGEISAGALALIALGTIAVRRPFTIPYARERVARKLWDSRPFIHTNYVLSWAWCGAFALTAIAGAAGVVLLDQPNNFWTCWTVQAGTMILAIQFGRWYPEMVRARARRAAGVSTDPEPPLSALVLPLCPYVTTLGILSLALESAPEAVGILLIVAGIVLTRLLSRHSQREGRAPHRSASMAGRLSRTDSSRRAGG
jgi:hypothetical protein